MHARRAIAVALLLTVGLGFAGAPIDAREPPQPVCAVCTADLTEAAGERGVTIERGDSLMTVRPLPNGTSVVEARVALDRGAASLADEQVRRAIVEAVRPGVFERRKGLDTALRGNVLVVRYSVPNTAHTTLGVLRFDAFVASGSPPLTGGGEGTPYPGADTLQLRAPAEYRLYGTYGDETNETTIVWHGDSHEQFAEPMDRDMIISFARTGSPLPRVRVLLAGAVDWLR
ncbi:MAG: hypothetical protein ABEJ55_04195 [Halanaeroarchaeum sp.]